MMNTDTPAKNGTFNSLQSDKHAPKMQKIITKPPSWLLRWGISLFFGVLLLIVALAEFIKYPDVIKSPLIISSVNEVASANMSIYADVVVSQSVFNKVKLGQLVLIKLKSYPFEEYGMLRGNIVSINDTPELNGTFKAKVQVTGKGISEFKETGKLKPGLQADAEIITEDVTVSKRLLESVFKGLKIKPLPRQ
jgi:hypothetical protein